MLYKLDTFKWQNGKGIVKRLTKENYKTKQKCTRITSNLWCTNSHRIPTRRHIVIQVSTIYSYSYWFAMIWLSSVR